MQPLADVQLCNKQLTEAGTLSGRRKPPDNVPGDFESNILLNIPYIFISVATALRGIKMDKKSPKVELIFISYYEN